MTTRRTEILTPGHPLWHRFLVRLAGPEGCDIRRGRGDFFCNHKPIAACAILDSLPGIDAEKTLAWLWERGGRCDCGILFNVAPLESDPAPPIAAAASSAA